MTHIPFTHGNLAEIVKKKLWGFFHFYVECIRCFRLFYVCVCVRVYHIIEDNNNINQFNIWKCNLNFIHFELFSFLFLCLSTSSSSMFSYFLNILSSLSVCTCVFLSGFCFICIFSFCCYRCCYYYYYCCWILLPFFCFTGALVVILCEFICTHTIHIYSSAPFSLFCISNCGRKRISNERKAEQNNTNGRGTCTNRHLRLNKSKHCVCVCLFDIYYTQYRYLDIFFTFSFEHANTCTHRWINTYFCCILYTQLENLNRTYYKYVHGEKRSDMIFEPY